MKLTDKAVGVLLDSKTLRTRLALELDFSERWILKLVHDNKPNNPITTVSAVEVIKKNTGLRQSEILCREAEHQRAA